MLEDILPNIQALNKLYLTGPFGSGKTTAAIERIRWLLQLERVRGDDIIVLTPQRTLATPYHEALRSAVSPAGAPVRVTTLASLVKSSTELYWPLLADAAGFADPKREPTFLTLETSQYHMARFVDEALEQADFDGIRVQRNRIISQVLDNLNKTALNGFAIEEAYALLELAVPAGEQQTARLNALRAAQRISQQFRQLCLDATLVDFSLQVELFNRHVLTNEWSRAHFLRSHRHLIFDNVEEDTAAAHRLVAEWMPHLDSALLVSDDEAGYRLFLGADPEGAELLAELCDHQIHLEQSLVMAPALSELCTAVNVAIRGRRARPEVESETDNSASDEAGLDQQTLADQEDGQSPAVVQVATSFITPDVAFRFYPQMIDWVAGEVRGLVEDEGFAPDRIAILAPFVSDAMRFSLQTALAEIGLPIATHRPSRALQDEPAARALLTLARLAHPLWNLRPSPADVTLALTLAIEPLDPVRAHLLSRIVFQPRRDAIDLGRFGDLNSGMQQRISYVIGESYDRLREWLYAYRVRADFTPLDQFFARLFGEILSQPGYGFHEDADAARVANQIVESARKFRWALEEIQPASEQNGAGGGDPGHEYVRLVESGALGALYTPGWREVENAVFLAPAYTFLMRNRPVDVQFWLDIGSGGWWERLYQPLTHPHVLSPRWPANKAWSDFDEFSQRQESMRRLLLGLIRRTRSRIYLGASDYGESGFEQRGPLLTLVNRLIMQMG